MMDTLGENNKPFYNKIVYNGSVGDDETYSTFKKALKTPIINIPPNNLMEFLKEHIRVKKKYFAIYKYVINHFKDPNKTMKKILEKHKLNFFGTRRFVRTGLRKNINSGYKINNKKYKERNNN
jgi:hypothetical protein